MKPELSKFYKDDAYQGFKGEFNPEAFKEYTDFVKSELGKESLIELGSGSGAAAYALHMAGIQVTASDIYPATAQRNFTEKQIPIPVLEIDLLNNVLAPDTAPNYSLYRVIEHLEDPQACIEECYRTLKPNGKLIIISPNLLSPLASLKVILLSLLRYWKTPVFKRMDGYTFPYGSSLLEAFYFLFRNLFVSTQLSLVSKKPKPRFRVPCMKKPAFSDSDAVFLSEPLTVRNLMKNAGFQIVSFQRPRGTWIWAGSLWIVGVKPSAHSKIELTRVEPTVFKI
ncbi:MAG: class I SAM-dependent methyltransferase [Bdellovibrio sp.]|nr:class I SAM-dependent methyltransferase [Bdellovibrio sp.]